MDAANTCHSPRLPRRRVLMAVSRCLREESEARLVSGAAAVRLRGFSTRVHRVDALVAYKADEDSAA